MAESCTFWSARRRLFARFFAAIGVCMALALAQPPARAEPQVAIVDAVIVKPLGRAPAAAYVTIRNAGAADDALLGASSALATRISLHRLSTDHSLTTMQPVQGGLKIAAGRQLSMAEEGMHLMVEGISTDLSVGESIPLELTFSNAGAVKTSLRVIERRRGHGH